MEQELEFLEYPQHLERQAPGAQAMSRNFSSIGALKPSSGLPEGKTKIDAIKAIKGARLSLGLSAAVLGFLDLLISYTKKEDWNAGATPVAFVPVKKMADRLGVSPKQINNYERQLGHKGLIIWNDSGNHRRYGKRDKEGNLIAGYGVVLSPIIERFSELEKMAEADRMALEMRNAEIDTIRALRRILKDRLAFAEAHGLQAEVISRSEATFKRIPRTFPKRISFIELCSLRLDAEQAAVELKELIDPLFSEESSDQSEQNFRHQYTDNTRQNPFRDCNSERTSPAGDEVVPQAEPADAGGIEEESRGWVRSPDNSPGAEAGQSAGSGGSTGIQHITFDQVLSVCSPMMVDMISEEAGKRGLNWTALDRATSQAAVFLGVNPALWTSLRAEIGPAAAAVCIVIIERRFTDPVRPVTNPGGFVRGMQERARKGKLHLHKSIFGLMKSGQSAAGSGLT